MPSVRLRDALIGVTTAAAFSALAVSLLGNVSTAFAGRENCRRIDSLYSTRRASAIRSFDQIHENARLLGIKLTPELLAKARNDRDRTLREYAPLHCSVFPWKAYQR